MDKEPDEVGESMTLGEDEDGWEGLWEEGDWVGLLEEEQTGRWVWWSRVGASGPLEDTSYGC